MFEILMVDHIDLPRHAEVFNGKSGQLAFAELCGEGAFGEDRDAKIAAHQILDRGYIVNLQCDIELIQRDVVAL